jgi:hypothetical protein
VSELGGKDSLLEYAGPATPETQTKAQSFRLDLNVRRNLQPLIWVSVVIGILIIAFVVASILVGFR